MSIFIDINISFYIYIFEKTIYHQFSYITIIEKVKLINNYKRDQIDQVMNNKKKINLETNYNIKPFTTGLPIL